MKKILLIISLLAIGLVFIINPFKPLTNPQANSETTSGATSEKDNDEKAFTVDYSNYVNAYKTGNSDKLTGENELETYNLAVKVIEEVIKDGMSDLDKERAIHDYILLNTEYDPNALAAILKPSEFSDTPYGALKNGMAICTGYATTFKLFMDMLDIECIIVESEKAGEHFWNMVKIGGNWYHVDVTWDDPVPDVQGRVLDSYFNVSDKFMRRDHEWDYENTPKT